MQNHESLSIFEEKTHPLFIDLVDNLILCVTTAVESLILKCKIKLKNHGEMSPS